RPRRHLPRRRLDDSRLGDRGLARAAVRDVPDSLRLGPAPARRSRPRVAPGTLPTRSRHTPVTPSRLAWLMGASRPLGGALPSSPITATSAVGQAKLKSARMCLEDMTSYAPPYALRVITASFGTVASQYAYSSFAPWRMIPPHSCAVPGRNPGTSTNVTSGMLKTSQVRTKRAPLTDESMSSTPASERGWLPTTPTGWPFSRANPQTRI